MTKTLSQVAIDAITNNKEFALLSEYSKVYFKKPLEIYYINYSLDYYNLNKHRGHIIALKESLIETIIRMKEEYQLIQEINNNYKF